MTHTTSCGCEVIVKFGDKVVSQADGTLHLVIEDIAYCPLHAAAGEMREALNYTIEYIGNPGYNLDRLKAAVAHAEGRPS